jgi:hypothetical protein
MTVIDNILPAIAFKKISDLILSAEFTWHFGRQVDSDRVMTDNYFLNGWGNIAYLDGYSPNPEWKIIEPILLDALERSGQIVDKFYRVRIILNTTADNNYVNMPHIDWDHPHRTALLYINDSDGPTLLYKEKYEYSTKLRVADYYNQHYKNKELTVLEKIEPKANRLLWFEGNHFHAGTTPTTVPRRVVININYTVKDTG